MQKQLVLHDYFESAEGGGRLCSVLAQGLNMDLGCGFAVAQHPFLTPFTTLRNLNAYSRLPLWRQYRLARAFRYRSQFIQQYNTVIYSGFYAPLAIHQRLDGRHIYYCHTPPRFIYDQRAFYQQQISPLLRPLLTSFIHYLQPRYETAIAQMDKILTNSQHVRARIAQHLKQTATVIYPPCNTKEFYWGGQGDYYLSTARLDPLKRVDKIIEAFLQLPDKKLIIASGGAEFKRLKKMAKSAKNITFTGWIDERQWRDLLAHAIATIYVPKEEDFGMSPVESMAAGKPVIGVAEGGLLESIRPEETGILLQPNFTATDIANAVRALTWREAKFMRSACEQQAQQFDINIFLEKMRKVLE